MIFYKKIHYDSNRLRASGMCVIFFVKGFFMKSGHVKWFSLRKGYGFIVSDDDKHDVFVHISELRKSKIPFLIPEKQVFFEETMHDGKIVATNLSLAS